jgi:c(7)-type cytochrome triheme protein
LPAALKKPLRLGENRSPSAVTFSHEEHNAEMECAICHPDIFTIKKKGTQYFSMETNIYGQYCGACHMRVAFPMNDCRRCHPKMSYSE